jgi:histidine triad (HIT) family protein
MSLDGVYDANNIFARILRGEIPKALICDDEATMAFMDAFPQSRGHCLVIPKFPAARNLLEADSETLCRVMSMVQRVARAARAALDPDGLVVTQFNGTAAGQTVFHLHVHIIPRWFDAPLERHAGVAADPADLADLAAQIAAKLET